ncbi:hypothetical protein N7488_011935 [Penicillium malachiteum]|nr:hypothetical protein N7488_011935 [Penicillium malachiteum]
MPQRLAQFAECDTRWGQRSRGSYALIPSTTDQQRHALRVKRTEDAMCAFQPISTDEDKIEMRLAFHWLPLLPSSSKQRETVEL